MYSGFVGKMCVRIEISCVSWASSKTFFRLNLSEKKIESPRKQYTSFPSVKIKFCCLPGILKKQRKLVVSFIYKIDKIPVTGPVIFQTCMGDWLAAKFAYCYYVFRL